MGGCDRRRPGQAALEIDQDYFQGFGREDSGGLNNIRRKTIEVELSS